MGVIVFLIVAVLSIFCFCYSVASMPDGTRVMIREFIPVTKLDDERVPLPELWGKNSLTLRSWDTVTTRVRGKAMSQTKKYCEQDSHNIESSFHQLEDGLLRSDKTSILILDAPYQNQILGESFIEFCILNPALLTGNRIYGTDAIIKTFIPNGINSFFERGGDNKRARALANCLIRKEIPNEVGEMIIGYDQKMYLNRMRSINFIVRQEYSRMNKRLPLGIEYKTVA